MTPAEKESRSHVIMPSHTVPYHPHKFTIPVEWVYIHREEKANTFILESKKVTKLRCSLPTCSEEISRA